MKRFLRWLGILRGPDPQPWWAKKKTIPEQIAEERFPPKETKSEITHYCPTDPHRTACGIALMPVYKAEALYSTDPRGVNCKNCRHTRAWKKAYKEVTDGK